MANFKLCDDCEYEVNSAGSNFCRKAFAVIPSVASVREAETRRDYQNYLVDLNMSYRLLPDWIVESLRDFSGRYMDAAGNIVSTPGIISLLTEGVEWWFRDQITGGKWLRTDDVPLLRREAIGRWRLVGTAINIRETVQPMCRLK